jgi:hypothetical protein
MMRIDLFSNSSCFSYLVIFSAFQTPPFRQPATVIRKRRLFINRFSTSFCGIASRSNLKPMKRRRLPISSVKLYSTSVSIARYRKPLAVPDIACLSRQSIPFLPRLKRPMVSPSPLYLAYGRLCAIAKDRSRTMRIGVI